MSPDRMRARYDDVARFVQALVDDLRIFHRGFGLVVGPAPLASVVFLVLGAVVTVTPVAQVLLAKFVVDSLADQAATAAFSFAVLYTLTLLIPAGAEPIQRALTSWLEARAIAEVDSQIHHLKKCKTSLEPAVKAGYDDL